MRIALCRSSNSSAGSGPRVSTRRTRPPYRQGMELDPGQWGPFVIMKPSDRELTSTGSHLQIFRTGSLSGACCRKTMQAAECPCCCNSGSYSANTCELPLPHPVRAVLYGSVSRTPIRAEPRVSR